MYDLGANEICGGWFFSPNLNPVFFSCLQESRSLPRSFSNNTLPETNIAPENGWLEYYFPFGMAYFQVRTVSFREGNSSSRVLYVPYQPYLLQDLSLWPGLDEVLNIDQVKM